MPTPKQLIDRVTELTYTLSSVNRATILATGEVTSGGWSEGELTNPRIGDGILHLDFVAKPPEGPSTDAIEKIEAKHSQLLAGEPQDVTVHAARNEMSVRLPAVGDPIG
jgi:hypothetical protein